jgi:hypothetical protein
MFVNSFGGGCADFLKVLRRGNLLAAQFAIG